MNLTYLLAALLAEIGKKAGFVEAKPDPRTNHSVGFKEKMSRSSANRTGKTAAFGLPTLWRRLMSINTVTCYLRCPTRELAVQSLGAELFRFNLQGASKFALSGGSPEKQIKAKSGAHIVVGTPGRLLDLIKRKALKLDHIETLILDEADEMLNMGFLEDIAIISRVPETRQTPFFSNDARSHQTHRYERARTR